MKRYLTALAVAPLALTLLGSSAQAEEQAPRKTIFDVSDLETGAPPKLVWTEQVGSKTVIHGDGGTTTITGDINAIAPMGSGFVVQTFDTVDPARRPITRWVGPDGTPGRSSWRTGYGLATSPDGEAVAFTTRRGGVKVIDQDGDRVLGMPSIPSKQFGQPAYVTNGYCKEDETSNGCAVLVNSSRTRESWVVSSHGIVDVTGFKTISTARGRWTGAYTKFTDTGTCSAMMRNRKVRWRTCDNAFSDISPDKQHVLGTPAYADGFGPTTLDALNLRTGEHTHTWKSTRKATTTYFDEVWEDSSHILVVTYSGGKFAIVRLGLDGSMEYAVEPVADRDGDMETPFHLQVR